MAAASRSGISRVAVVTLFVMISRHRRLAVVETSAILELLFFILFEFGQESKL
jgi:hypothetical protein